MSESPRIKVNHELLHTLLRSNMSCNLGKKLTLELIDDMASTIIESFEYFLNKKEEIS